MRKVTWAVTWAVVVAAMLAAGAPLQAQVRFGVGAAWGSDSHAGISGRMLVPLQSDIGGRPLTGQLAADWYVDSCDVVECSALDITPAAHVAFAGDRFQPYAGAGLNIVHIWRDGGQFEVDESDLDLGIALLGGLTFPLGGLTGQTEGRFAIGANEQLILSFSLLFGQR